MVVVVEHRRGARRGRRAGRGRGAGAAGRGRGAGRGRKRAGEEIADLPLSDADNGEKDASNDRPKVSAKRVCLRVPVTAPANQEEGKAASKLSFFARRCLARQESLKKAALSAKRKALFRQRRDERMKLAKADDYHSGEGGSQSNRDHGHGLGKRGRTGCAEADDDGDGSREASEDSSSALSPVPDPAPNAEAGCVGVKRRRVGRGRGGSQLPVGRGERGRRPGGRGRPARSERRRTEAAGGGGTPARTESSQKPSNI